MFRVDVRIGGNYLRSDWKFRSRPARPKVYAVTSRAGERNKVDGLGRLLLKGTCWQTGAARLSCVTLEGCMLGKDPRFAACSARATE